MLKKSWRSGEGGGDGQRGAWASLMVIILGQVGWQGGVLGLQGGADPVGEPG